MPRSVRQRRTPAGHPRPTIVDATPLQRVDVDEPEAPDDLPPPPPGVVHCQECTTLIGPGYLETEPFPHPHGKRVVCFRCLQSLERRAVRRGARAPTPLPLGSTTRRPT